MSGHSKWANIKSKKGVKDKARGTLFSKLSRVITLAVLEGGGLTDPENNIKLRLAVEKAKEGNMPKENIQRAIERGIGPNKDQIKEVIYEGFGPGGAALILLTTTDSPNRTLTEIRNVMDRHGGKLGIQGSVNYLFKRCGLVIFEKNKVKEDDVFGFADKIKAFDIEEDKEQFSVYFPFENLGHIKEYLKGIEASPAEIDYKPLSYIKISEKEQATRIINLIEALEELDDVHKVFANFDIPEEFLK